ncbi:MULTISPECIES: acyl-ACP--UDP-N-acetylglucosamine O-acyltransferase [Acidiphilium]|uniref:Acyl-[acyl-carrier-protein]--UDP-N-acetylglucosamine O-acyltransferase n=1 Tax=Acidiphilium rubrum TaxID=526 RepID=A0A8G2FLF4_ACIRU|nr:MULTISPECIES: acyl-ACP--UDP-N-acetylglucosamine O-acyltransferase [Acidiphilium]SIQ83174.1 acyl-[acyl-carrier-protein]--UDP-N-acetylglucosamine O-acyltransferase [Acidiphilium rubrum]
MIHPLAVVDPNAKIGARVHIGPFCMVGPGAILADGVDLVSHVVIDGRTSIGEGTKIFPFATIGMAPQDLKYKGEDTETIVGARCTIREHATINRGTAPGGGITRVGDDCLLMTAVHVAHDCQLGNGIVIANNVVMGGHVEIADRAIIGGAAAIHQFVRIGQGAMIGGMSGVEADVIPYGMIIGNRARLAGLNIIGLRRRNIDHATIHHMRATFNALFRDCTHPFQERLKTLQSQPHDPHTTEILAFAANPGKRGLIRTTTTAADDAEG